MQQKGFHKHISTHTYKHSYISTIILIRWLKTETAISLYFWAWLLSSKCKTYLITLQSDAVEVELLAQFRGALQVPTDQRFAEYILHSFGVFSIIL